MSTEEEYTENEVLRGAELYLYLLRQNEEQRERAQSKLREYAALKDTLQVLTERSRRRVLAPVAGGLAYFAAELNATNTIVVLLGDSWFAERSAVQAAEIAGRRLDFLRREVEALRQEDATLRSKQEFFLSEMPEAQDVVVQLLAEKDALHATLVKEVTRPSSASPVSASSSPPAKNNGQRQQERAPATAAAPSAVHVPKESAVQKPPNNPSPVPSSLAEDLDYSSIDAALATFDEQDELTEDELIALEKELGDRLEDDAYVEQIMTERMIQKKERRVRAELGRRQAALAGSKTVFSRTKGAGATATHPTSIAAPPTPSPSALSSDQPAKEAHSSAEQESATITATLPAATTTYRTPGDIGHAASSCTATEAAAADASPPAAVHVDPAVVPPPVLSPSSPQMLSQPPTSIVNATSDSDAPAASPASSTCSSSSRKERHVHFRGDTVSERKGVSAPAAAAVAPSTYANQPELTSSVGAATTEAREEERAPASPSAPFLLRSTYRVADIVEHTDAQLDAAMPPPPLLTSQRQKPKRKSLFMRDLEDDSA
ncbi:hypothetical protein ABB37_01353 [Leptomonas pyrrhocoris]|uniref:Uncharacterized protein n=1 Tax=Leptomonas pyrrhocoris TaxID=157538 RepID=A0A0N0VH19_LEPPY|nr:hypothetical protein ABB37_01353 [Leptomonas pyrrhocoris]KPA84901.1 hypothetical protein ABB37_01353 [Leptomonas pyrrhocoris]|eukprot:XP_015663340.1 hypothetical protein ABB37_01353 [Leptomonas pyrrhocoris]